MQGLILVFPAHAGVILDGAISVYNRAGFSRTCGGDVVPIAKRCALDGFSRTCGGDPRSHLIGDALGGFFPHMRG